MKFCPDCGKKLLKEDLKFCPECGAALKAAPAAPRAAGAAQAAQAKPKGPLVKYWAWTAAGVLLLAWLLIFIAAAGYHDDSLRKTRADSEARITVQLSESKPLLDAQRKVLVSTAVSQYVSALQVDAMAIQQNSNKMANWPQLNESEQLVVAHDFAMALKDTVDHCDAGRIFVARERALLEASGANVTQIIGGLDQMEDTAKKTAAGVLAATEKEATPAEKEKFSEFFGILRSIG